MVGLLYKMKQSVVKHKYGTERGILRPAKTKKRAYGQRPTMRGTEKNGAHQKSLGFSGKHWESTTSSLRC